MDGGAEVLLGTEDLLRYESFLCLFIARDNLVMPIRDTAGRVVNASASFAT